MALFKCKMCGGALEIDNNETVATCEYCSTQQTLPRLDDDRRANLYDRANHFRRNNEYDKAMGIYEQILTEDNTDAEAYWSLVLCRYGIEYVEDPTSHKRVPTVNRAQFTSVFDDDNYKSALQYADSYQKSIYEDEAKAINVIQKGILAISQKEEPFDVFICYKETDNYGRRTPDSVLANDLYHQLTQEGFKVFFSRITLEDKLGVAYEPYIFAALNSAKVMVALGTKPEYFNAVWVKNEWSRYLGLIKNGAKKILIPAYKDMDPYDLPEEFSHLQAQDMSKLGFMQDLIRGIKKITQADAPKTTVVKETVIAGGNNNIAPLLERAFMFLEDKDWASANEYCEKVLDIDPKNAQAYLGKLMAELCEEKQEALKNQAKPFDGSNNYQKTIRFADDKLRTTLMGYIEYINTRNEHDRVDGIYTRAKSAMSVANTEGAYKEAARLFETINGYQDSKKLAQICYEKAEIARKNAMQLKEYLLNILQLETSLQKQSQVIDEAENALKHTSPIMPAEPKNKPSSSPPERQKATALKPSPPRLEIGTLTWQVLLTLLTGAFGAWILKLTIDLFGTFGQGEWNVFYVMFLSLGMVGTPILLIFLIGRVWETISWPFQEKKTYPNELKAYEDEQAAIERKYAKAMAQYEESIKAYDVAMKQHQQAVERAKESVAANKQIAEQALETMKQEKAATNAVLKQYYSADVIQLKYRNPAALMAICGYLDNGRCATLAGANGAYSIYEEESRRDMIHSNLETVISKLEKIQRNQVLMLGELQKIRRNSETVSSNMKSLLESSNRVEKVACLTDYCSAVAAVNTAATAYYTGQIERNTQDLKNIALGE